MEDEDHVEYIFIEHDLMELGYKLVTEKLNYFDMLEKNKEFLILPFDPTSIKESDVKMLEEYFASIDEFDKAIVLRDLNINNLNNNNDFKCRTNRRDI
jgi:hypothetical protein